MPERTAGVAIPDLREFWLELLGRVQGPMKFRVVLQPIMAAIFAIRSGLRDAREGRPPFFSSYFAERHRRREILGEGWRDVGRVFVLAVVIDVVYQAAVLHAFRPLEAAVVGVVLAIVPYLIFRGAVNRLFGRGI